MGEKRRSARCGYRKINASPSNNDFNRKQSTISHAHPITSPNEMIFRVPGLSQSNVESYKSTGATSEDQYDSNRE